MEWSTVRLLQVFLDIQLVRLVVNDRKFSARIVFFSHTKSASSNNPRSYTIVSAPAEQAIDPYKIYKFSNKTLLNKKIYVI